jgi:hypothetical protein
VPSQQVRISRKAYDILKTMTERYSKPNSEIADDSIEFLERVTSLRNRGGKIYFEYPEADNLIELEILGYTNPKEGR